MKLKNKLFKNIILLEDLIKIIYFVGGPIMQTSFDKDLHFITDTIDIYFLYKKNSRLNYIRLVKFSEKLQNILF
jgi:hypothetical protein